MLALSYILSFFALVSFFVGFLLLSYIAARNIKVLTCPSPTPKRNETKNRLQMGFQILPRKTQN